MGKLTYLLINLGAVLVPFIFSFHPRIKFNKEFAWYWPANIILCLILIPWDMWFINKGIWDFNDNKVLGLRLFRLPLEEGLFFVCILYCCVFSYFLIKQNFPVLLKHTMPGKLISISVLLYSIYLVVTLPWLWNTCGILISLIIVLSIFFFLRPQLQTIFWVTYAAMFPPFLLVNGLLTGMWQDEPVTVYNPAEMLNIRLWTIPLEDVFYGMMMIALNILLYEIFKSRHNKRLAAN